MKTMQLTIGDSNWGKRARMG